MVCLWAYVRVHVCILVSMHMHVWTQATADLVIGIFIESIFNLVLAITLVMLFS